LHTRKGMKLTTIVDAVIEGLAAAEKKFNIKTGVIICAIHYCGAHRIGHGTRLYEDGDLLNYVNDHRIPLEICLTSNVQTGAAPSLSKHPLRFYYDYGLRLSINTDNRLISDTTVTNELYLPTGPNPSC